MKKIYQNVTLDVLELSPILWHIEKWYNTNRKSDQHCCHL